MGWKHMNMCNTPNPEDERFDKNVRFHFVKILYSTFLVKTFVIWMSSTPISGCIQAFKVQYSKFLTNQQKEAWRYTASHWLHKGHGGLGMGNDQNYDDSGMR